MAVLMVPSRLFLVLPVAAALGLVLGQGCALFTCVEDDCDSLSGGAPGTGGANTATGATVTSSDVTASSASGGGGSGGEGGSPPELECSDDFGGNTAAVVVADQRVYVVANVDGFDQVFTVDPITLDADPPFSTMMGTNGRLAAVQGKVFYSSGTTPEVVVGGEECKAVDGTVHALAGAADRLLLLRTPSAGPPTVLEARVPCEPGSLHFATETTSVEGAQNVFFLDRAQTPNMPQPAGPCFLPSDASAMPSCADSKDVLGIALPAGSGGSVGFYRTSTHIHRITDRLQQEEVHAFSSPERKRLPMAVSSEEEIFFATGTEVSPALWRCRSRDAASCVFVLTGQVVGLALKDDVAYFSQNQQLCRWDPP
jgi:hypothetical protein